jgi:hypothetical protein
MSLTVIRLILSGLLFTPFILMGIGQLVFADTIVADIFLYGGVLVFIPSAIVFHFIFHRCPLCRHRFSLTRSWAALKCRHCGEELFPNN